jgi:hypothetical protein
MGYRIDDSIVLIQIVMKRCAIRVWICSKEEVRQQLEGCFTDVQHLRGLFEKIFVTVRVDVACILGSCNLYPALNPSGLQLYFCRDN